VPNSFSNSSMLKIIHASSSTGIQIFTKLYTSSSKRFHFLTVSFAVNTNLVSETLRADCMKANQQLISTYLAHLIGISIKTTV